MNQWEFWVIIYLTSAVIFAHSFKKANRRMTNAGSLTILLEFFTALFAILFIPFFEFKMPYSISIYIILLIVIVIYSITDRLNIESRYGLDPSTFSMLKQLSTVFMIILGLLLLKEKFVLKKMIGALSIIAANVILAFEKGKLSFNKYFIMSFISNFLFAIAMMINVNIADNFNLGIYTITTVLLPSILIFVFERHNIKELRKEFSLYNKKMFLLSAFTWCLMLISSVRAYQLGNVSVVAPLFALTSILNAFFEFFVNKNKSKLVQKIIAASMIVLGVCLIKM
jgi:drug/metabolite transporter (DMT)-like permease